MADAIHANTLADAVRKLYISKEYADFTITCNGRLYRLHKAVVCPQSKMIATMLRSKFKEGIESHIDLSSEHPDVVDGMIRYLYGCDYTKQDEDDPLGYEYAVELAEAPSADEEPTAAEEPSAAEEPAADDNTPASFPMHAMLLNAKMYLVADYYLIRDLKELAIIHFHTALESSWDAAAFVEAAGLVYDGTQHRKSEFRESMVDGFLSHKEVLNDDNLKLVLQARGELMYDVARALSTGKKLAYRRY